MAAGDGGDRAPTMPLVFQCRACRVVVGDSLSIEATNDALGALTLTRVAALAKSDEIATSTAAGAVDRGSTFHPLTCAGCAAPVGKVYVTTVPALDALRGRYTLDTEAISSYELGVAGAEAPPLSLPVPVEQELRTELRKVQGVILSLHERLSAVEARGGRL